MCVQANWLINEGVLSQSNISQLTARGHLRKVTTGGNGRKALIEFNTMRTDIKNKVIEIAGDPYTKVSTISFTDYIEQDQKAYEFFENYTLDSGEALPEKNKKEYLANANVLNAINNIYQNKAMQRKALAGSKLNVWQKITEVVSELPRHTYPHSLLRGRPIWGHPIGCPQMGRPRPLFRYFYVRVLPDIVEPGRDRILHFLLEDHVVYLVLHIGQRP